MIAEVPSIVRCDTNAMELWADGGIVRETRTLHTTPVATDVPDQLGLGVYRTRGGTHLPLRDDSGRETGLELAQWQ